jgi:catechol 2,3-dioxygenase-like lactoylglutathione lyase family enzyme
MDGRPDVWVGHLMLAVRDVQRSADFWRDLGMREIERNEDVAIMELRGGTHLLLVPGAGDATDGTGGPFDLMVDDLEATHARWQAGGLAPTPIAPTAHHTAFEVRDPDGYVVSVYSSHVVGDV